MIVCFDVFLFSTFFIDSMTMCNVKINTKSPPVKNFCFLRLFDVMSSRITNKRMRYCYSLLTLCPQGESTLLCRWFIHFVGAFANG